MGVYSLEAANYVNGINANVKHESAPVQAAPYADSIMEFGLYALRADQALFESLIELDFRDKFAEINEQALLEANDGHVTAPKGSSPLQQAQANRINSEVDKAKAEEEAKNKLIKSNQRAEKVAGFGTRITEAFKKIVEFIKRAITNIAENFKTWIGKLHDVLSKGESGEKYAAALDKVDLKRVSKVKVTLVDKDKIEENLNGVYKKLATEVTNGRNVNNENYPDHASIISTARETIDKIREKWSDNEYAVNESTIAIIKDIVADPNKTYDAVKKSAEEKMTALQDSLKELADSVDTDAQKLSREASQDLDKEVNVTTKQRFCSELTNAVTALAAAYRAGYTAEINSARAAANKILAANKVGKVKERGVKGTVDDARLQAHLGVAELRNPSERNAAANADNTEFADQKTTKTNESALFTLEEATDFLGIIYEDLTNISAEECFEM
jgi:hypothetical protein